jgi:hypothetical protein
MKIVKLEGEQARYVVETLSIDLASIYSLRIALDEGGVKFKVNEQTWSPAFGAEENG